MIIEPEILVPPPSMQFKDKLGRPAKDSKGNLLSTDHIKDYDKVTIKAVFRKFKNILSNIPNTSIEGLSLREITILADWDK